MQRSTTIRLLIIDAKIRVSQHAFLRILSNAVASDDPMASIGSAEVLQDLTELSHRPAVLVLQYDTNGGPFHAVWGIEKDTDVPAVLITTYRPDPALWSDDFRTRKP